MTAITIHCPVCNGPLQIDPSLAGQQVHCPLCQGLLQLPAWEVLTGVPEGVAPPPYAPPEMPGFGMPPPPPTVPFAPQAFAPPESYFPPQQQFVPQGIPQGVPMGQAVQPLGPLPAEAAPFSPPAIPMGVAAPSEVAASILPTSIPPAAPSVPAAEAPVMWVMACPACSSPFEVKKEYAEQAIRCPKCSREMTLPKSEVLAGMLRPMRTGKFRLALLAEKRKPAEEKPTPQTKPAPQTKPKPAAEASPAKTERPPRKTEALSSPPAALPPASLPAEQSPALALPPTVTTPEANLPPPSTTKSSESEKSQAITDLLPPGVSNLLPPATVEESTPQPATMADVLLPPGAVAGAVLQPGEERALPVAPTPEPTPQPSPLPHAPAPKAAPGTVILPTADGRYTTVREVTKTVGYGHEEVELRRLTDEEKTRRRFIRNLILVVISLAIIGFTFYVMMPRGGR